MDPGLKSPSECILIAVPTGLIVSRMTVELQARELFKMERLQAPGMVGTRRLELLMPCEENGRPEWTRTIDLFRVKEAL
jgi:hypothetical protein